MSVLKYELRRCGFSYLDKLHCTLVGFHRLSAHQRSSWSQSINLPHTQDHFRKRHNPKASAASIQRIIKALPR
jgi:hypothetical protein